MDENAKSQVKIISHNPDGEAICAGAARISTTADDAYEIFEKSKNNGNNAGLIKKVLKSGHKSLIEHAVFTLAFKDVSAYVEQFFIECRLASFTIKSRRYVNFGGMGYYIPAGLEEAETELYCRYMDLLFEAYRAMLDGGIPKEDARFLLPYSFCSNFYCTMNARELIGAIRSIRCGRGREIPELQSLADRLTEQIVALFPSVRAELEFQTASLGEDAGRAHEDASGDDAPGAAGREIGADDGTRAGREIGADDDTRAGRGLARGACEDHDPSDADVLFVETNDIGIVRIVCAPQNPVELLKAAHNVSHAFDSQPFGVASLLKSDRPRELEQLSYSFEVSNITLSGITHIARHRMQSIIIPPIQSIRHNAYVIPDSVKKDAALTDRYKRTILEANGLFRQAKDNPALKKYGYYFALSGHVMRIMTTMNAREISHFIRLRSCNRAQWEIRGVAIGLLKRLREKCPVLFDRYGPGCFMTGVCPEGNMTCGECEEVKAKFSRAV
jgi:thymidylate synthase (FAD)